MLGINKTSAADQANKANPSNTKEQKTGFAGLQERMQELRKEKSKIEKEFMESVERRQKSSSEDDQMLAEIQSIDTELEDMEKALKEPIESQPKKFD